MRKISDALRKIIQQNSFLLFGLHHGLLNLSQVARYLRPQIQARLGKDVEESALIMNLSRIRKELAPKSDVSASNPRIENISVHSQLCILAFSKNPQVHTGLNKLYAQVAKDQGYITITEGITEVAVILERRHLDRVKTLVSEKPRYINSEVSSLAIKFDSKYLHRPGLYYTIFQQLYFQQINILEIASAGTELILYIGDADVQLAFDTLYHSMRAA